MPRDDLSNPADARGDDLTPDERLVEAFLPEALGWPGPPDVAARVVAQVKIRERFRWWRGAAVAAIFFLGVSVGFLKFRSWRNGTANELSRPISDVGIPHKATPELASPAIPTSRAATEPYRAAVAAALREDVAAPAVLRGNPGEPGCMYATEENDGTLLLGGNVKVVLAPWSTVTYRGSDDEHGQKLELLDGIVTVLIPARSGGRGRVSTQHIDGDFDDGGANGSGATVQFRLVGKFYLSPPEGTLILTNLGDVHVSGAYASGVVSPPHAVAGVFPGQGLVSEAVLRGRLYPRTVPVPDKGEFVSEGPMSYGPSGWTIRAQSGNAYLLYKEPELVGEGVEDWRLKPRFRAGWIYKVRWIDGVFHDAQITREPAVLFR